MQYFN